MMDKVYEHAVRGDASLTEAMSIPVVREILDPYVQDILSQHGNMAQAAEQTKPLVGQVLKLINVGRELAQQAKPAQKVAPDRADSFAGKQANPSKQGIYGEQLADTLRGMTGEQRIQHLRSMQTKR
jgi:hypothetical protein